MPEITSVDALNAPIYTTKEPQLPSGEQIESLLQRPLRLGEKYRLCGRVPLRHRASFSKMKHVRK